MGRRAMIFGQTPNSSSVLTIGQAIPYSGISDATRTHAGNDRRGGATNSLAFTEAESLALPAEKVQADSRGGGHRAADQVLHRAIAVLAGQALAGLLERRIGRLPAEIQQHDSEDHEHDPHNLFRSHRYPPCDLNHHLGAAHS